MNTRQARKTNKLFEKHNEQIAKGRRCAATKMAGLLGLDEDAAGKLYTHWVLENVGLRAIDEQIETLERADEIARGAGRPAEEDQK